MIIMRENYKYELDEIEDNYNNIYKGEGWYIHGRRGNLNIDLKPFIELTQDFYVASYYAGQDGSIWILKPNKKANILDMNNKRDLDLVFNELLSDFENYSLNPELDEIIEISKEEDILEDLKNGLNPRNIVDNAEFWDVLSFVPWLREKFKTDFVYTYDGAIALNLVSNNVVMKRRLWPKN